MQSSRCVLHVDLDAFFASVEQAQHPELRGRPVVVGGLEGRGVVTAASYEARALGVRAAMPMASARRLCPQAIFVEGRFDLYVKTSQLVMEILERFSPVVEQASLDEAYLDYHGCEALFGPPAQGAEAIRTVLRRELGLPGSVGIATSRLMAKIASAAAKPDGVREVSPGTEAEFLAPLAVGTIPGVGPAAQARLAGIGCRSIAQLQALESGVLVRNLGESTGRWLAEARFGRDPSPVRPERGVRSLGHETTFEADLQDEGRLLGELRVLVERAGFRMRRLGLSTSTVTLKLRYAGFETPSRSRTLPEPTVLDTVLYRTAADLFLAHWDHRPVRLLGVSLGNLAPGRAQAGLFQDHTAQALQQGLDQVRSRFGSRAVFTAASEGAGRDGSSSAGAGSRHEPAPDRVQEDDL